MSSTTNNTVPISSTDGVKTSAGSGGQANQMASGIKGVFAKVHGAGEEIRGTFNQGVDEAFHEPTGVVKNHGVAQQGRSEMETGKFSEAAKVREGMAPGVAGTRSDRST